MNYLICSTHRSGSSWLSDLLCKTGMAGKPAEHFLAIDRTVRKKDYYKDIWPENITPELLIEKVKILGTDKKGNFGCSIMWETFVSVSQYLQNIPIYNNKKGYEILNSILPDLKVIRLVRRSKIRQAISLAKAMKTGAYNSIQEKKDFYNKCTYEDYNFYQIFSLINKLMSDENNWKRILDINKVNYITIYYEDMVNDVKKELIKISNYLNIDFDLEISIQSILSKQSNDINDQWYHRFMNDLANIS